MPVGVAAGVESGGLRWRLRMPGGGGTGPGRGWSRSRSRSRRRRRSWPEEEAEAAAAEGSLPVPLLPWMWAPALALAALLLLVAGLFPPLASGLGLALAAAGGAWAARRERSPGAVPPPPGKGSPLANGGPAAGSEGRRRRPLYGEGMMPTPPPPPFVLPPPPRRRYPIHQAQYASLGTLPSICWDGYGRKSRLSAHNSSMVQSPVTVKIARPDSGIGHSSLLEQLSSPAAFSPAPNSTLDPCAKETVLSALRESRKRVVEDEEEEEDQNNLCGQESKRRRHDSGGSGQSAFEPLVANGAPASLVPKPGSLKRGLLSSHGPDESCSKRSRTSSLSSLNSLSAGGIPSSIRNAIASSYSSTRGLSQMWKRSGPSASPLSGTTSPRSQTPERPNKKARYPNCSLPEEEDSPKTSTSTLSKADNEVQAEHTAETALQSGPSPWASLSPSGSDGKRKRKIQLLSTRRGDHFALPPPPQLGYPVTSEDLDAEKQAALQWFNKVLEDKTDSAPSPPAEAPASSSSSVPSPLTFSLALSVKPPGSLPPSTAAAPNPLLESLKKMQDPQSTTGQADPGASSSSSTTTAETPPLPPASASLPLGTSTPVTSEEGAAKPLPLASPLSLASTAAPPPPLLPPPPAASGAAQPACGESAPVTTSSLSSSELSQTPSRPSSAPKPSILFGILTSPPDNQPLAGGSSATTAPSSVPSATAATTAPIFKPIFGTLAKSETPSLSSAGSTLGTFSASPGTLPSMTPPSLAPGPGTFKPIFGGLPTSTTTAASSPFTFQPASTPASTTATPAASSVPGFPAPCEAGAAAASTLASLLSTTAGVTSVSASKPVFSFGTGLQALGGSGSMATPAAVAVAPSGTAPPAALPSQPLLFGASSTTTGSTTVAPLFQFGKLTGNQGSMLGPLAGSASSTTTQAAPSTTATAPGGFNIFSSSSSGSSTLALTAPSAAPTTTMPATITAGVQPSLTFGLGASAFGGGFGTASKGPPPPYSAEPSQLTFDAGAPVAKPSTGPVTFGTPFSFTGSVVQPAAQPAFGAGASSGGPQPAFGGPGPLVSFGAKSTSQPAFGSSTPVFSFGAATTAAGTSFGSSTQTTTSSGGSSTGSGSVFGAPAPAPFAFGASSQPAAAGALGSAFGIGAAASAAGTGVTSVGFSFGGGQSAGTGTATPFGSSLATNPLSTPAQSSTFAFGITGTPDSKLAFGGAPTPTFGQSTPAAATSGAALGANTLSFGTPVTPAFGGAGPAFGSSAPAFSIGAGAKTGSRQRLQARRQHTRKK